MRASLSCGPIVTHEADKPAQIIGYWWQWWAKHLVRANCCCQKANTMYGLCPAGTWADVLPWPLRFTVPTDCCMLDNRFSCVKLSLFLLFGMLNKSGLSSILGFCTVPYLALHPILSEKKESFLLLTFLIHTFCTHPETPFKICNSSKKINIYFSHSIFEVNFE